MKEKRKNILTAEHQAVLQEAQGTTLDLFDDFNGMPEGVDKTEFYRHELSVSQ